MGTAKFPGYEYFQFTEAMAEHYRQENPTSGPHWTTKQRFVKLFDLGKALIRRVEEQEAYIATLAGLLAGAGIATPPRAPAAEAPSAWRPDRSKLAPNIQQALAELPEQRGIPEILARYAGLVRAQVRFEAENGKAPQVPYWARDEVWKMVRTELGDVFQSRWATAIKYALDEVEERVRFEWRAEHTKSEEAEHGSKQ